MYSREEGDARLDELLSGRRGLSVSEADLVPRLVAEGLQVVVFCASGVRRSLAASEELALLGIPAVGLHGGLGGLTRIGSSEQQRIIKNLLGIPYRYCLLERGELRYYHDLVSKLQATNVGSFAEIYEQVTQAADTTGGSR